MKGVILKFIPLFALFSGCISGMYKVSTSEDDKNIDNSVRYYEIEVGGSSEAGFIKAGGCSSDGILYDEEKMPIEIVDGEFNRPREEMGISGGLCVLTLGIIPAFCSQYMTQNVTIKSPIGEKTGSYRVDAKYWMGWLPIFIGYPCFADEREMIPTLPNARLEKKGRDQLIKRLIGEFSYDDYVAFAKKENAIRKAELERIAATRKKIEDLLANDKYDDAAALCEADSKARNGSLECDKETWDEMKKMISDKKEDCRVANKKAELEALLAESKFEDVETACRDENDGESRHAAIWADLKHRAENAISERDRKIELARIEKRKVEIAKLLDEKKYAEVIDECNKEGGMHVGSRPGDSAIWSDLRKQAQEEKYKIDRAAEERRISVKLEHVNKLLSERKFVDVVALCDEERGQNAGSRPEDLSQWQSIRSKALAENLLSSISERSKTTFCLRGFYIGMTIDEAEVLLDYYFPNLWHSRSGSCVVFPGRAMPFCEASQGKVTRFNFNRKMLDDLFDYDYQTHRDWVVSFAREYVIDFRSGSVRDKMDLKGWGRIDFSQDVYQSVNRKLKYRIMYFGEHEDDDHENLIKQAARRAMIENRDWSQQGFSASMWEAGFIGGFTDSAQKEYIKQRNNFFRTKGAEEGTLRIESID